MRKRSIILHLDEPWYNAVYRAVPNLSDVCAAIVSLDGQVCESVSPTHINPCF